MARSGDLQPRRQRVALRNQRPRGVRRGLGIRPGERRTPAGAGGGLGRLHRLLLPAGAIPGERGERGRLHRGHRGGHPQRRDRGFPRRPGRRRDRRGLLAQRDEDGVLREQRHLAVEPLRLGPRDRRAPPAHEHPEPGDRRSEPGGRRDRPVSEFRRARDPVRPLPPAPGHAELSGSRARVGPRRTRRPEPQGLPRADPASREQRLRGAGGEQPGLLGLRQDLLPHGRQTARRRGPEGLRGGAHLSRIPRLGGREPDRDHRRQLRWLHGGRRARLRAGGLRRGSEHLRGHELGAHPLQHSALVGPGARCALCGTRRSGDRTGAPDRDLAPVPRRKHRAAPLRGPGRQRPAGAPGGER